jgi:fructose-1,6-bisphosphatase/inositol monophosphatase family enzyme
MVSYPRVILESLLPTLQVAARYAQDIQPRIVAQPDKPDAGSTFAAALTDADLSIQTAVEIALLGLFPQIHFYGEEYAKSYNTKYFVSLEVPTGDEYLVLLDPVDGTQFYLDGHKNYHIMLSVVDRQDYCAVFILNPPSQTYYYALRGEGAFRGTFAGTSGTTLPSLTTATPLLLRQDTVGEHPMLYLGSQVPHLAEHIPSHYQVINLAKDYSKTVQVPNHTGILEREFCGSALGQNKLIDVGAVAFVAQEAGCQVSTLSGQPLPPLSAVEDYSRPGGVIIATHPHIHQRLREAAGAAGYV